MRIKDNILHRKVTSKHYFVKHRGYAFDTDILAAYIKYDWHTLKLHLPSCKTYSISKDDVIKYAMTIYSANKWQYLIQTVRMTLDTSGTKTIKVCDATHSEIKKKAKIRQTSIADYLRNEFFTA
jgi:hypothetical protein